LPQRLGGCDVAARLRHAEGAAALRGGAGGSLWAKSDAGATQMQMVNFTKNRTVPTVVAAEDQRPRKLEGFELFVKRDRNGGRRLAVERASRALVGLTDLNLCGVRSSMPHSTRGSGPPPTPDADANDDGWAASVQQPPEERSDAESSRPSSPTLETEKFVERAPLGRGGSSVVVRAFDKDLLRDVAIKVLLTNSWDAGPEAKRFVEEAQITGQLEHPNIVPIYEFGVQPSGQRFLCMRLVEGQTLEDALNRAGPSRLEADRLADFLQVFVKVCDAVSFAHSRGVIHRDLKPTNIMISDFGQVYVLDWGIARLLPRAPEEEPLVRLSSDESERRETDPAGVLMGTPAYMAPEQLQGSNDSLDERTDVFALGGTLYQILTGRPALSPEIIRAIWRRQPSPAIVAPERLAPGAPAELSRISMRALEFDPAHRYGSVGELKRDIEQFQRGAWHLPRVSVPAGTVIIRQNEPGNAAYVIQEGRCSAYRVEGATEVVLRVMGPGDVFGETAVFSDKPRTASVKALTDVVMLVVTSSVLAQAVGLNSWMGAFVRALADRFREADERLRTLE
jgi:eukaryotic-like serine/threonine-protein kinase